MDKLIRNSTAEFLIFTSASGEDSIEVKVFEESVWLTQTMIAQLFDTTKQNISLHIKNIFESGELDELSVVKDFLTTDILDSSKMELTCKECLQVQRIV